MDFFLRHLRANRSGILIMLAAQFGLFLFGIILVMIINRFINEELDFATVGSMMALMGSVFGGLLRGSGGTVRYRMAVCMGRTRRSYILADPVITALNCLVGIGFSWVLSKVELALYTALYPGWVCSMDLSVIFQWKFVLVIVAGVCFLDFCLGALQLRRSQGVRGGVASPVLLPHDLRSGRPGCGGRQQQPPGTAEPGGALRGGAAAAAGLDCRGRPAGAGAAGRERPVLPPRGGADVTEGPGAHRSRALLLLPVGLCPNLPGALPLDPAAFEKAGETFYDAAPSHRPGLPADFGTNVKNYLYRRRKRAYNGQAPLSSHWGSTDGGGIILWRTSVKNRSGASGYGR